MRNPFVRLACPAAARPSLRERAAALKASASRVIRRDTVDAMLVTAADPIFAAIEETQRLTDTRTARDLDRAQARMRPRRPPRQPR